MTIAAAIGGSLIGNTVGLAFQPISNLVNITLGPADYVAKLATWNNRPIICPVPAAVFDAFNKGLISEGAAQKFLSVAGIPWRVSAADTRGVDNTERENIQLLSGEWEKVRLAGLARPTINMGLDLWAKSHITTDQLKTIVDTNGGRWDSFDGILPAMFQPLDLNALLMARNRGILSDEKFDLGLQHLGYKRPLQRFVLDQLRESIPPISDLITFAIKDVWNPRAVQTGKLFDGLPREFQEWADKQGLHGGSGITAVINGIQREAKWAEVYWAAHWQPLSPSLAYVMFQRLREGRMERYSRRFPGIQPFTEADLNNQLQIADYPPGVREWLAAVSYNQLRLADIRRALLLNTRLATDSVYRAAVEPALAVRGDTYNRAWAIEQFLDRGLHPDDAAVAADLAVNDATQEASAPIRQLERRQKVDAIRATLDAYALGVVERDETRQLLRDSGMSETGASNATRIVDTKAKTALVKTAVNGIKRDYFAGIISAAEVLTNLTRAGLVVSSAEYYRDKWVTYRDRTRRTATTQQLLAWLKEGLIAIDEVRIRLTNLGWSNTDQLLLLREASIQLSRIQARTLATAQRQRQAQAKELENIQKQALAHQRQLVTDLRAALPRTTIQSALRKGIASAAWARARLLAQGWPLDTIEIWIREALPDLSKLGEMTNGKAKEKA